MADQSKRSGRLCCTIAVWLWLSATAAAAHADTLSVYKWIDKDGVVSYSQTMPTEQGAHNVTTIRIDSLPLEQQRAASRMLAHLEKLSDAETDAREQRLAIADQRIDAALGRLQQAEHRLSEGSTPTGDDRIGTVGGHARLRDSYFERVSQLQADVGQAQQALSDAYAARDRP
jgi:hypothetical protein